MTTQVKNGRLVHYVFRGGRGNDMTSECGKSMETPNASYTTSREKVTCKKCLKDSRELPDHGGDPQLKIRRFDVQLEIDCNRGVIYAHAKDTDIAILRICGVPMPTMRGLAGTPIEFIPQLDISLRENLPAIAGVANLAMARKEAELDKAFVKRQAVKKAKEEAKITAARKKAKKIAPVPEKSSDSYICFRIYVDGKFKDYSYESNAKAAVRVYRKKHGMPTSNGVVVEAKTTFKRS